MLAIERFYWLCLGWKVHSMHIVRKFFSVADVIDVGKEKLMVAIFDSIFMKLVNML